MPSDQSSGGSERLSGGIAHGILGNVKTGDTLRVELADGQIVAEVDDTRRTEEGDFVAQGVTIIEDGHHGNIYDLETQHHPRDGWSSVEVSRRVYRQTETEWLEKGIAEEIVVIDSGIEPDRLDPGVTVESVDGDRYRVVEPPWEREYDDKALTYNLDNGTNACEKLDPSEVVRRVE